MKTESIFTHFEESPVGQSIAEEFSKEDIALINSDLPSLELEFLGLEEVELYDVLEAIDTIGEVVH